MNGEPFFTVAIATYNRADRAVATCRRVLEQSWTDLELVVVDDGSTDGTSDAVAAIDDPRVRVVRRANGGISAARNTGAAEGRGRYLVVLDDDDEPEPTWLERLGAEIEASGAAFVSCGAATVTPAGEVVSTRLPAPMGRLFGGATALVLAGTFAVDRTLFEEVGGYTEGLQCSHQTDLALRLLPECRRRGLTVGVVPEPLLRIERRPASDRPESSPAKLLSGTTYLLEAHAVALAEAPVARANYHAIAGVAAARLGERRLARTHFREAARARPREVVHWTRLAASYAGPIGARAWRSSESRVP